MLGEFTHLAILVEALSTVIGFNMADMTVFLGQYLSDFSGDIDQQVYHIDMSD